MKGKYIFLIWMVGLVGMFLSIPVYAKNIQMSLLIDGQTIVYDKPKINLILDGRTFISQQLEPIELDGSTFVSAREVFEYFDAVVDWKESTREIFIGLDGILVVLQLDNPIITINGITKNIPMAPKLINGNSMIPIRVATEAFGFTVDWDHKTQTATISVPTQTTDEDPPKTIDDPIIKEGAAVDKSTTPLTTENHPKVSIHSIHEIPSGFSIVASGPISKVDKMLLSDNRLVLDIHEATAETRGTYIPEISGVGEIRTSQFQVAPTEITRVVLDLAGQLTYQIAFNHDRTEIIISFESQIIEEITFETKGTDDIITITGRHNAPDVSIFLLKDPQRLAIDLPMSKIPTDTNHTFVGDSVSGVRLSQFEATTGRIALDLKNNVIHTVTTSNNKTIITISKPTYSHIYYDYDQTAIVIPKVSGADIILENTIKTDRYEERLYTLTLSTDISKFIGYGSYIVDDYMLNSFQIESNGQHTVITAHEKSVVDFILEEDESNYYLKARRPKDVNPFVVVLDPGHGGSDPGTAGHGYVEKDLNLAITLKLYELLLNNPNITVYSTRLSDVYPTLDERVDFANGVGDLFISVHNNSFTNPASSGTETYYYPHSNDGTIGITSEEVAGIFHKHLIQDLELLDRGVKSNKYIVLTKSSIPSVLLEIGFVSNIEEVEKLNDPAFQDKIARAIYNGILEIMQLYYP